MKHASEWQYATAPDLDQSLSQRLRAFPRQPSMMVYGLRGMGALGLRTWLRLYHRLEIKHRENLPAEGSFVLVGNHCSHLDALCFLAALPLSKLHRAFPAAAADYFFSSFPRTLLAGTFINGLPFDRLAKGEQSLALCRELLANPGNILIIFPEGTRSTSGDLGRFRSGIGRLVVGTPIPVIPCWLEGAFAAWPKGKTLPRPKPLRLEIGTPHSYQALADERASVEQICQDLEQAVNHLRDAAGSLQ